MPNQSIFDLMQQRSEQCGAIIHHLIEYPNMHPSERKAKYSMLWTLWSEWDQLSERALDR